MKRQRIKDTGRPVLAAFFALFFIVAAPSWARPAGLTAEYICSMGEHLPPDPGLEGQKTLGGSDTNHNGIRDDVERWIYATFPGKPIARAATLQLAGAMQNVMSAGPGADATMVSIFKKRITAALECLLATTDDGTQKLIFSDFQSIILNTPERAALIAGIEKTYPVVGVTFDQPSPAACAIALELLGHDCGKQPHAL